MNITCCTYSRTITSFGKIFSVWPLTLAPDLQLIFHLECAHTNIKSKTAVYFYQNTKLNLIQPWQEIQVRPWFKGSGVSETSVPHCSGKYPELAQKMLSIKLWRACLMTFEPEVSVILEIFNIRDSLEVRAGNLLGFLSRKSLGEYKQRVSSIY